MALRTLNFLNGLIKHASLINVIYLDADWFSSSGAREDALNVRVLAIKLFPLLSCPVELRPLRWQVSLKHE